MSNQALRFSVIVPFVFVLVLGSAQAFVVVGPAVTVTTSSWTTTTGTRSSTWRSIGRTVSGHHDRVTRMADRDDDEREYARIRRRGRGKEQRPLNDDASYENVMDDDPSRSTRRRNEQNPYYRDEDNDDNEWDFIDDLGEQWEGEFEEMEKHDLLGNVLIPNPILDNIDPDGAADRFPELAKDPRFWFDMVLFIAFLDFLSLVGPRDPFPDLPLPYGPMSL